jgi:hypothetical protein
MSRGTFHEAENLGRCEAEVHYDFNFFARCSRRARWEADTGELPARLCGQHKNVAERGGMLVMIRKEERLAERMGARSGGDE